MDTALPLLGNADLLSPSRREVRAGFLGAPVWVKHPAAKLHPPTGKPHSPTRVTREVNSRAGTRIPTSSELRDSPPTHTHTGPAVDHFSAQGIWRIPTHNNTHTVLKSVSRPGLERGPRATCSLAHLVWSTSPISRSARFPLKALTCSTLSVQQLTDSWESLALEQPPKCWGDELRALVTPKSKTLARDGKAPQKRTSRHSQQKPPRRAG